jgi:hypothetical protein
MSKYVDIGHRELINCFRTEIDTLSPLTPEEELAIVDILQKGHSTFTIAVGTMLTNYKAPKAIH